MTVDDTLLMEYVDGVADSETRIEIERELAQSPELAERLAAMQASVLPIGAALAQQALPPVPRQLAERVEKMAARASRPAHASNAPWLAVAFIAGAFCTGMSFKLLPMVAGNGSPLATELVSFVSPAPDVAPWVQAVVDYQVLYSRATLADVGEDHQTSRRILDRVRVADGMPLQVPDLREAGLTFKRVQELNFQGHTLVQIAYLPRQGTPVALCAYREAGPDTPVHMQTVQGMQAAVWRRNHVGYALVVKGGDVDVEKLGARIVNGETPALYGALDERPVT